VDLDDVRRQVLRERDVRRRVHDALAEQEAGGQLEVVARRAHRDRDRLAVQAHLERELDGDLVHAAVALHRL
jgi:hypothetical protein